MYINEKAPRNKIIHLIRCMLLKISPKLFFNIKYMYRFKKPIRLNPPQTFNEHIIYLNLHDHNPLKTECADKYAVRKYITDKGCGEYLPKLIGIYGNVEEIDWTSLPNRFAMKCTHGCKYNIICSDKNKLDIEDAKDRLRFWLSENYYYAGGEWQYKNIRPQIICEEYIAQTETLPIDWKFYCIHGNVKVVSVITERNLTSQVKLNIYDLKWNELDLIKQDRKGDGKYFSKPKKLNLMIELAEALCTPFPYVRVDFFEIDGSIYIGELTFTPGGGFATYYTMEGNKSLGYLFNKNNDKDSE